MKIFLDPGHGGTDSGCTGGGLREADVVFEIAYEMRKLAISTPGSPVEYAFSRPANKCPTKQERADRARKFGADAALVLHLNSAPGDTNFTGVFFVDTRPAIWKSDPDLGLGLAVREIKTDFRMTDYRIRAFNCLWRYKEIPAVLLELFFLDRPASLAVLREPDGVKKIAERLHTWVCESI